MPFCTNCGTGVEDNERFCSQCGYRQEKMIRSSDQSRAVIKTGRLSKPRNAIIAVVGIALVLMLVYLKPNSKPGLPKEINQVVFEESVFSIPITFRLPCEDHPDNIESFKKGVERYESGAFPPIIPSNPYPAQRIDEKVLDFLINNGFANIEEISSKTAQGWYLYKYVILTYTEKISPFIYTGDYNNYGPFNDFEIQLASRQLKSIDYINEYENPWSAGLIFAVTFSYSLKKDFPYLEELIEAASGPQVGRIYVDSRLKDLSIDKTYQGEAEAYLDPSDGQWKLVRIILEDRYH